MNSSQRAQKKNRAEFPKRRFVAGELDNQSFDCITCAKSPEGVVANTLEHFGPFLKTSAARPMNHGKTCIREIMCAREPGDPLACDAGFCLGIQYPAPPFCRK